MKQYALGIDLGGTGTLENTQKPIKNGHYLLVNKR